MCLIGGKNVKQESDRLSQINIILATPGRLLHHFEETPFFNVAHLPMLGYF
jgi:ATP-dependent RNA helicase DDX10/DBP4